MIWKKNQNSRLTFGILINQIEERYSHSLWRGFIELAQEKDINIVFFVGRSLQSPYFSEPEQNLIYEVVDLKKIDGLIVSSGALSNFISMDDYKKFLALYSDVPIVSLSIQIPGIPSIVIDNKLVMKDLISHLITVHQYKRIAFIKGPERNIEADERYKAYLEVLQEMNIPFDPDLVVQGDFRRQTGTEAIRILFDERKLKVDAIAASNDTMALSAYQELEARGFRIPEDIAITGFDDLLGVQSVRSPLTTVDQMFYNQARTAMELLADLTSGKDVPEVIKSSANIVVRRSCGCSLLRELSHSEPVLNIQPGNHQESLKLIQNGKPGIIEKALSQVDVQKKDIEQYRGHLDRLLDQLVVELQVTDKPDLFIEELKNFMNQFIINFETLEFWNKLNHALRSIILNLLQNSPFVNQLDSIFFRAQILIGKVHGQYELIYMNDLLVKIMMLRKITKNIISSYALEDLLNIITDGLTIVGIKECYLCLFDQNSRFIQKKNWSLPEFSRLILAYRDEKRIPLEPEGIEFETRDFLPKSIEMNNRFELIALPLCNLNEYYGYIIFDMSVKEDVIYSTLMEQISSALSNIKLYKEKENAKQDLQNALEALKVSEEKYKEIATLLPTIIIETHTNYQLRFLNQAGYEAFGLDDKSPLTGISMLDYIHNDDRNRFIDYNQKILNGGTPEINEFRLIRKDGSKLNLLGTANPIHKNNSAEGIRWSALDIRPLISASISLDEQFYNEFKISPREVDVLKLWLQGYHIREIAKKLYIAESTVKIHIGSIYDRLNVKSKTEFFNFIKDYQIKRHGYESFLFSLVRNLIME